VIRIAKVKIGKPLQKGEPFAAAFWACIFDTNTVQEFEKIWKHMLNGFRWICTSIPRTCGRQEHHGL
jgi:hypothetical protein